jgi:hypothetical protein
MTDPRSQALADRIWAYAQPREWDVTIAEVAEALGEPMPAVRAVSAKRGWSQRMRRAVPKAGTIHHRSGLILGITLGDENEWA